MSRASRYPFNPRIDATSFPRSDGPIPPFDHAMAQRGKPPPPPCSNAPRPKCSPTSRPQPLMGPPATQKPPQSPPVQKNPPFLATKPRSGTPWKQFDRYVFTDLAFCLEQFPFSVGKPRISCQNGGLVAKNAPLCRTPFRLGRAGQPSARTNGRSPRRPFYRTASPPDERASRSPLRSPTTRRRRKSPPSPPSSGSRSATTPTRSGGPLLSRHARRLERRRKRPK